MTHTRITHRKARLALAALAALPAVAARAYDISAPAILQDFENTDATITNRMPDIFSAGYGAIWFPPPGRADSGNSSVGYDVYNRFDLGSPGNPTLYGTQSGLKQSINAVHTMGGNAYIDLLWNHSGFENTGTNGFAASGGYPGFAVTLQNTDPTKPGYNTLGYNDVDGDYHSSFDNSTTGTRVAGLDDIAQEKNYRFYRQPVTAGYPNNIPTGSTPYNGRIANQPNPNNAIYYPDTSLPGLTLSDPTLSGSPIHMHPFNLANPMNGTPVIENDQDYLQRYAQWMIQVIGADGFRVDAAKNMPTSVMDHLDLSVYHESNRTYLNGQQMDVWSFQEVYDGDPNVLQPYVKKTINPAAPNTVGGNRDVLDFPLFFAMQSNLSSNGAFGGGQNNWNNVVNASIDTHDDGKHNGSQGVMFAYSHDIGSPYLGTVAYAYTLMQPGNAVVYFNGHEFGTEAQRNFPKEGREDALGGAYGDAISNLVDLRNRYGRGNYKQDLLEQNSFAMERQGSVLLLFSNTTDPGFDSRTVPVHFAPGTPLVELTGNAGDPFADPNNKISKTLIVNADSTVSTGASVNARFLRNSQTPTGGSTYATGDGYLIYGLATPTGTLSLTNINKVMSGTIPNTSDSNIAFENGTDRITDVDVIKSSTFDLSLHTTQSNLIGYGHDHDADGSQALIRVDGGIDVSGSGFDTTPGDITYGFTNFVTVNQPGYSANGGAGGDGQYTQTINTSQLGQGYHYITVMALRHNADSTQPQVYNDWKQAIYVDTAPANSTVASFNATGGTSTTRNLVVQSVDQLANNTHVFLDLPLGYSDSQVLALIGGGNQPTQTDVDLWQKSFTNVGSGNHTVIIVSYKPDGSSTVQRFNAQQIPSLFTTTSHGVGFGDLNFDNTVNSTDINTLPTYVQSNGQQFNPAADVNGDGFNDLADVFLLGPVLVARNVDGATQSAFSSYIHGPYVTTNTYNVIGSNTVLDVTAGTTNVTAGASLTATDIRGNALLINNGGVVTITPNSSNPNAGVSKVSTLSIAGSSNAWKGTLNLSNNDLILQSTTGARTGDYARTLNQMLNGAITASSAGGPLVLAVTLNDDSYGHQVFTSFDGQTVDLNSVLVKFTVMGDTNLDDSVNVADLANLAANFGRGSGANWITGDFDYNGNVNVADLADLAANFGSSLSSLTVADAAAASAFVPEPAVMFPAFVFAMAAALHRKCRTRLNQVSGATYRFNPPSR
jgi:hypothetical protein